ncbi:hypothetical protein RCL1_004856 [Eukaryota sp. TZLM3-RCL]
MFLYVLFFLFSLSTASHLYISRPLNINSLPESVSPFYSLSLSSARLLILSRSVDVSSLTSIHLHLLTFDHAFITTSTTLFSPSNCITSFFSFNSLDFPTSNLSFDHLKTGLLNPLSEDIILIAFEFFSSNLNNQYDQLSLKVFSLLNLQESNTFEFIIESDFMSLYFNEFSLEQDQSIIANITITHNSDQCTTEFPHEVQFNSIVSCSFCISNTGYTNTSSLQIIDKSIELQTNVTSYCSFLKKSVPLFLFVSDYKLVIRDVIQRRYLETATPLSGVRSVDYISSTDSKSLFMVLICNENNCQIRHLELVFDFDEFEYDYHVISLAAGEAHSAAVLADGTVKTWGRGTGGRLGHYNTQHQYEPRQVEGISDAVFITCGLTHTLVLRSNAEVYAFGHNFYGQIGDRTAIDKHYPVPVFQLSDVCSLSAGAFHSIALKTDGTVWSWGSNQNSQLGRNPTTNNHLRPELVPSLSNIVAIASGSSHNVAMTGSGTAVSWGNGLHGRLGIGQTSDQLNAQQIASFTNTINVFAGNFQTFILLENGELWACGLNNQFQLGLGNSENQLIPSVIIGFTFAALSPGTSSSIGLLTNGDVVVWGQNQSGQLTGYLVNSSTPMVLSNMSDVYAIAMGTLHTLVACSNGTVLGWGGNEYGQVGNGENVLTRDPVAVKLF